MFTPKSLDPLLVRQWLPKVILISLTAGTILPLAEIVAVTDWFGFLGSGFCYGLHKVAQLILLPAGILPFLILAWFTLLFSREHRKKAVLRIVYGTLLVVFVFVGYGASHAIRYSAIQHLTEQSQFLIDAVKEYETRFGYPPSSVRSLVPYVLQETPTTGMAAYPQYELTRAKDESGEQGWILSASCPSEGLLDFAELVFLSDGDYNRYVAGNPMKPINGWAYIEW
jgi:hypothetical protein